MREEFVHDLEYDSVLEDKKELDIYEEIDISKKKLQSYYENMNYVEGNMIDYYVYQIKAEQAKFRVLAKRGQKTGKRGGRKKA